MTSPVNALAHTSVGSARSLAPARGVTPPRPDGPTHKFLSDALVARGFVTQRAMDAALHASRTGRRYSEILVNNGDLSDADLARTLADHHHIDHVDLDVFPIDADVKALVPAETAGRLGALPVALLATGEVVVAVHDPEALSNMAEIAKRVGRAIRPVVASRSQVERHIAGHGSLRGHVAVDAPDVPAAGAPSAAAIARGPAPTPAAVAAQPARAPAPEPIEPQRIAERPAAADDHAHMAQERSQIAERARALAQYRDEMAPVALGAEDGVRSAPRAWAPAPDSEPQARALGCQTVPPDPPRQATVVGAEARATTVRELEQRLADAESRLREADVRASTAERRMREADARAAAADEQAHAADARTRAAEKQAEGLSAAATTANEALAQLAQARLISDQTARASAREIESLSNELGVERSERRRLENELQRRVWQERNDADAARRQAAAAPNPGQPAAPQAAPAPFALEPLAPQPAVEQAVAAQPAPQPVAAQLAPQPAAAQPAPQPAAAESVAAQPAPQPVAAQPAPQAAAAQPALQPAAAQSVAAQPVAAQPAPQPAAAQPVAAQPVATQPAAQQPLAAQPSSDAKKVRGLRRMISALRRP